MSNRREFIQYAGAGIVALACPAVAEMAERIASRPIPGTGERLPVIGLGNSSVFRNGDVARTRELLTLFMKHGGAYVDTSGRSRFTVGQFVREKNAHDQLFLGTYVGATDPHEMRKELASVVEAQGGGTLDLVVTRNIGDYADNPSKYRQLKEAGITRYVGVARHQARFYEPMMTLIEAGAVDFVQANYSLLEPEADRRLLPMASDKGVAVITNRPFINGEYFSIVRGRELPYWAAEFDCQSWAQFSLKFILSNPAVNCVLTETSNPKHAVDNLGAGLGRIPDEKMRKRMLEVMREIT